MACTDNFNGDEDEKQIYTFSFFVLGNHLNGDHFRKAR